MNETKREGYIRRIENALKTDVTEITHEIFFTEEATREILELLKEPSAEPKTGRWIDAEIPLESGGAMPIQVCDQCNTFYPLAHTGGGYHFCPNCGAKMLGEDGEEE